MTIFKMMKLGLVLLATSLALTSRADDLAKHNCAQPAMLSEYASELQVKSFDRHMKDYKKCIDKFVEEQREVAKTSKILTIANNANESAEKAVKEYNDFIEALQERNKQASGNGN